MKRVYAVLAVFALFFSIFAICEYNQTQKTNELLQEIIIKMNTTHSDSCCDECEALLESLNEIVNEKITPPPAEVEEKTEENEEVEEMVWLPENGKKYHSNRECGMMYSDTQVTVSEAKEMGYESCKNCYR